MEDEFKTQLQHRIESYRQLQGGIQDRLRDLHHELNSVERRLEAAEELYRREFGEEPGSVEEAPRRRATRIRGTAVGQPSWKDAVSDVLRREARPMHVKEIWQRLQESGFQTAAQDPLRSITAIALRSEDEIKWAAPNTFVLSGIETEKQPTLYDEAEKSAGSNQTDAADKSRESDESDDTPAPERTEEGALT